MGQEKKQEMEKERIKERIKKRIKKQIKKEGRPTEMNPAGHEYEKVYLKGLCPV